MGDLTLLKDGILREARDEAARIRQEADERARDMIREAQATAESRGREILGQAGREAEARRNRIQIAGELENKRESLEAKDRIIAETINMAIQKIHQLPLDRKTALFIRLLLESAEAGTEEVRPAAADRSLIESLLPQVNTELIRQGRQGLLKLGPNAEGIDGGFIVAGDRFRADNSLASLVTGAKDDLIPEVARVLFK